MRSLLGGLAAFRFGGLTIALLALAPMGDLFVGFGNVRAGVVGIRPTTTPPTVAASANSQSFTLQTTGLGGSKISGIGLYSNNNAASTATLTITGGVTSIIGTFAVSTTMAGAESGITWNAGTGTLAASTLYTFNITNISNTNKFMSVNAINGYTINPNNTGINNYWSTVTNAAANNMALVVYYDGTSIPEPATMILTGSALVAGAIGAFFIKCRRRLQMATSA